MSGFLLLCYIPITTLQTISNYLRLCNCNIGLQRLPRTPDTYCICSGRDTLYVRTPNIAGAHRTRSQHVHTIIDFDVTNFAMRSLLGRSDPIRTGRNIL